MIAIFLSLLVIMSLFYFLSSGKEGYVLSFFLVFPYILPTLFKQIGIEGGALITRYMFFMTVLIVTQKYWLNNVYLLKKNIIIYPIIFLIIALLLFNSLSTHNSDLIVKVFERNTFIYIFIPFFLIQFFLNNEKMLIEFVHSIPFWGILFVFMFIIFFNLKQLDFQDRISFFEITGFDTITSSRLFGVSLIVSYMLLLKSSKMNLFLLISFLVNLLFILIVGQRGTLIGVFLGLVFFTSLSLNRNNFIKLLIFFLLIVVLLYLKVIDLSKFEVFNRFYDLKNFRDYKRFADYPTAWQIFKNNSFWGGEGSWGYKFSTGRVYPHSIILESMTDYGLLGLLAVLSIIIIGLFYSVQLLKNEKILFEFKIVANIWIMLLCSVLVSGNIVYNYIFFVFSAILSLCYILAIKPLYWVKIKNIYFIINSKNHLVGTLKNAR